MRIYDVDQMEEELQENQDDFKREKQQYGEGGIVDLNTVLLDGLVRICWAEGLIEEEVAHAYLHNHSQTMDKHFL